MTEPDYFKLIDAEIWAFIRKTEESYPPDAINAPVARQREIYDRMCRDFDAPYPAGVLATDRPLGGVAARVYLREAHPRATVLYFHGGGFVVGGLHSHDGICAEICGSTGYRVTSVDYRLAPEHRHPAAFDDAVAATRAAAGEWDGPLVIAGDSAGANLAAAVAHATRDEWLGLRGMVLIYAGLAFGRPDAGSLRRHANAPLLTRADVDFYASIRMPEGGGDPADPTANPLNDSDFTGLPPAFLSAAECDPLADDSADYAARIVAAGGTARCVTEPGLVHGWLRARHMSARARNAFARIVEEIKTLGEGALPR
ncbi:MAG: alpha/beta hydrolase [Paracoccaceae bacterium]